MNGRDITSRTVAPQQWTPSLPTLVVLGLLSVAAGFGMLAIPAAPPLLYIAAGMLALAVVAMLPRRWGAAVAGVTGALLVAVGAVSQPFTAYHLAHPGTRDFAATLLLLAGAALAGVAGGAATTRALARADRRSRPHPPWGLPLVTALAGVCVGAIAAGAVARDTAPAQDGALANRWAETMVAADLAFTQAPAEVPSGEVVVELRNDGDLEHDVTIAELDDAVVVSAHPGQTARGAVELAAGTYTYYCSVPGHRDAGMEGTLRAAP